MSPRCAMAKSRLVGSPTTAASIVPALDTACSIVVFLVSSP